MTITSREEKLKKDLRWLCGIAYSTPLTDSERKKVDKIVEWLE